MFGSKPANVNHASFPFAAVVGQHAMKSALLAVSVDPSIGGVLIRGEKGTAKSTIVRGFRDLLPSLAVVPGCPYHCLPDAPAGLCPECRGGAQTAETQIPVPLVELPLGATEDRLVGTLDVEAALSSGLRKFDAGLLAAANRGILYVDEVNLLEDHLVDLLLDAAASGVNTVEREGISLRHPARFILLGTMNPEEGELRPQFLDRFGLCVTVTGLREPTERMEVIRRRAAYEADPQQFCVLWQDEEQRIRSTIAAARNRTAETAVPEEMLRLAVEISCGAGVSGHRADLALVKCARAFAALLEEPSVTEHHLYEAARFVLPHRFEGRLLRSPEEAAAEIEQLIDRLRGVDLGETSDAVTPTGDRVGDDDFSEEALEAMQIPGGAAAGSILFPILKKKSSPMLTIPRSAVP